MRVAQSSAAIAKTLGSLELDRFVVSDYCDLSLHFHHDPIEDQLSKYDDYEVVKDLMPQPRQNGADVLPGQLA